jgi:undecaprenyl-phosphate 4-deoxy-4-formamido-L-arabinose transferase
MLRGYSREIARTLAERDERHTFIPALAYLYARSPIEIPVAHSERHDGRSKYSLLRLFRLHLDLLTGFSVAPMRLLFVTGVLFAFAGLLLGATLAFMRILHGPHWAADGVFTLFAILFVFVGAQFFALGLIGEYVGRTLGVVRRRPTYVLRELPEAADEPQRAARSPREHEVVA